MKLHLFLITIVMVCGLISCSKKSTEPLHDTLAAPTFSLPSYMYYPGTHLSITAANPRSDIRYTIDGSTPNEHSNLYFSPIHLESSMTIKARAFKKGLYPSTTASATYEIFPGWGYTIRDIVQITASPDSIYADNGLTHSMISVKVQDGEQFGVIGQLVKFKAASGNIQTEAITDSVGIARSMFWAGGESRAVTITAFVLQYHPDYPEFLIAGDTAFVDVTVHSVPPEPADVHSMQFVQTGQIDLNVVNTGGVNSALLQVKLLDENGELVTTPQDVWFKITTPNPPDGANLNGYPAGDSVLAISNGGIAEATIYSGTGTGILNVRASCTSGGNYLHTNRPNIFIHGSPPNRIEIFAGGYNSGINMGGGLWKIIVGARVFDMYDNPVSYGTSVWFHIPENNFNCLINANAYVGNESAEGDSTAGVAYTTLVYSGNFSLETIQIAAETGGINGTQVIGIGDIILPANQLQLELEIVPGNLVFHGNTNPIPASATATLNASVFDVQGCAIPNVRISMTSTHGVFEPIYGTNEDPLNCNPHASPNIIVTDWYDQTAMYEYYYDPYWQIPGGPDLPGDDQDGLAQGQIRFFAWETPLSDSMHIATTLVTITARIPGTDLTASSTITLVRYPT